jgi:predicted unusual protein kinase regulating ubiquinone biosynthesis (AarF/ABC1/UbiB family)
LREIVIAVGTKDSKRILKAYQILNILLPGADLELIEQAEAAMFDRFWGKSMDELSKIEFEEIHEFAKEFRELVFEMPFQVPQNLIFLLRMVAILSGICTGLDRDFNVWEIVMPYAEKLIAEEVKSTDWLGEIGAILQTIIALPRKTESVLDRINRGSLVIQTPGAERRLQRIEHTLRRVPYAILFFAFLSSGVQLYLQEQAVFAGVLLAGAAVSLIATIIPRRGHRAR